jgi:hypothetical protein
VTRLLAVVQLDKSKAPLDFVTFKVNGPKDLLAMRKALGGVSDYFEADLTAFTTVRAMTEALSSGKRFDIPSSALRTLTADDVTTIAGAAHDKEVRMTPSWTNDAKNPVPEALPTPKSKADIDHKPAITVNMGNASPGMAALCEDCRCLEPSSMMLMRQALYGIQWRAYKGLVPGSLWAPQVTLLPSCSSDWVLPP